MGSGENSRVDTRMNIESASRGRRLMAKWLGGALVGVVLGPMGYVAISEANVPSRDELREAAVAYDDALETLPQICADALQDGGDPGYLPRDTNRLLAIEECRDVTAASLSQVQEVGSEYWTKYTRVNNGNRTLDILVGGAGGAAVAGIYIVLRDASRIRRRRKLEQS
jgi:hypothetical protein